MFYKETSFKNIGEGATPKDWRMSRLGELANGIFYGITAKAVEKDTGLRMLRTTDITDYRVDWEALPYCEVTDRKSKIKRYLLRSNDLVVARAGTTGVSVLVEKDLENTVFGSYLIKVALNSKLSPKFTHYFFQSQLYWNHIARNKAGSTLKNITLPILDSLGIPLPPIAEQLEITNVLATVDEAIQKTNEIISKAERLKKGLMQVLLTKGMAHKDSKDSEIGRIPKEWVTMDLGELLDDIRYGTSVRAIAGRKGVPILGIPNVLRGEIDEANLRHAVLTESETRELALKDGDILLVRTNANPDYIGRCALFSQQAGIWAFASYLIRIRPNANRILPSYLVKYLQSDIARKQFLKVARTSAGNYNANTKGIQSIVVPVPSITEQEEIARILIEVDSTLQLDRKEKAKLNDIKHCLVDLLLTGQVRVKVN